MKKFISLLIALTLIFTLPLHAYATTSSRTDYFKLTPSNKRLNDMGEFDFEIFSNARSDHNFKTISNSITVSASAQVYCDDPIVESPRNEDDIFLQFICIKLV